MTSALFRICLFTRRAQTMASQMYDQKLPLLRAFTSSDVSFGSQLYDTQMPQPTAITPLPSYHQAYSEDSVDSVLSYVRKDSMTCRDTVFALKVLRVQSFLKNVNFKQLTSDKRFELLCQEFEKQCHILPPSMLISGLRSFLEIGLPPSHSLIDNIGLVILSKVNDFFMINLVSCLHLYSKHLSTTRQHQIVAALVKEIQDRVTEINVPIEVLMLLESLHLFDKFSLKKLQSRLFEFFPKMELKDLIKVISILAENNKRNKSMLNTASFYLCQNKEKPNLKETVNLLYSMNTLNYLNQYLLTYLTDDRQAEISTVTQPSIISGLLNVCGQMKWRHPGLLEACGTWILENISICTKRELVSYLLTIAALNYIPKDNSLISTIMNHLKFEDVASKVVWLDVVWSLAILDSLDKDLLIHVLSPDFYKTLLEDSASNPVSNKLKLMNLKAILKIQYPEFVFSCDLFLDAPEMRKGKEAENCEKLIIASLAHLVPGSKYMCKNQNSDMGVLIDAEFIMDKNGKALPLLEYGLMCKPTIAAKNLPLGAKRVALMIWLYKDFTLNENCLTGANALAVRLLSSLGHVVVEVPFGKFVKKSNEIQKVKYLSEIINTAIMNHETDAS